MLYFLTGRPPDSSLTGADFLPLLDWSCLSVLPSMLAVLSHGGVWRTEGSDGRYTVRPTTRLSASPAIVGHNHQDTTRNKQETDCRLGGRGGREGVTSSSETSTPSTLLPELFSLVEIFIFPPGSSVSLAKTSCQPGQRSPLTLNQWVLLRFRINPNIFPAACNVISDQELSSDDRLPIF